MSYNCLVSKLKGASSATLPTLNKLVFSATEAGTTTLVVGGSASYPVKVNVENATLTNNSGTEFTTLPITVNSSTLTIKFVATGTTSKCIIIDKYNLRSIDAPVNLKELNYCSSLVTIGSYGTNLLFGDISQIGGLTSLETLQLSGNTKCYGNIATLGGLTSLTKLALRNTTKISGNIEDMIAGMIKNGRTSATTKAAGIDWTSLLSAELVRFKNTTPSTNGYFLWEAGQNAGEYVITYKKGTDDSTISSTTIIVV